MKILITGSAGFIGYSLAKSLLIKKFNVYGIDNFDKYYSVKLKKKRITDLKKEKKFNFYKIDIRSKEQLNKIKNIPFAYIFHFAAQPGVRYSLINPKKYFDTNVLGFQNLLDVINKKNLKKIVYASSSSVYGDQKLFPVKESASLNAKNPYGVSKIESEIIAENVNKNLKIPFIGLRLFTVYGPWGRPDMFIIKLLNCLSKKKYFYLNNSGNHFRDFTYIDDVVNICEKIMKSKIHNKHLIFNVCSGREVKIIKLTQKINNVFKLKKKYIKNIKMNKADVYKTHGSNKKLKNFLNYKEFYKISYGLSKTINWYFKFKKNLKNKI